jgi:hypothetical protein
MMLIESVTNSVLPITRLKILFRESVQIHAQSAQSRMKVIKNVLIIAIKDIIKIFHWDYAFAIQELTMIRLPNYAQFLVLQTISKVRLYVNVFLLSVLKINIGIRQTSAVRIVIYLARLARGQKVLIVNHAIILKKSSTVNAWIAVLQDFLLTLVIIVSRVIFNVLRA